MTMQLRRMTLAIFSLCSIAIGGACSSRSPMPASTPPASPSAEATPSAQDQPSAPPLAQERPVSDLPGAGTPNGEPGVRGSLPSDPVAFPPAGTAGPGGQSPVPQATECSKACATDADCACGTDTGTGQCAFGNKSCIDTSRQCPDFCTGIHGQFVLKCVRSECTQTLQ
jgi:hypothetical protein